MSVLLQLFLFINVALLGAAIALAVRYGLAHFRPEKHDKEHQSVQPVKLPPQVRQQLLETASKRFEKVLEDSAHQLQLDLSKTAAALNKNLESFGSRIIEDEMKRYRTSLDELQRTANDLLSHTTTQLDEHRVDLEKALEEHKQSLRTKMDAEILAEKQQLLNQIDTKLADAQASFLVEALGSNVDLGAQLPYLTDLIEKHKDDFKKEVDSDAHVA